MLMQHLLRIWKNDTCRLNRPFALALTVCFMCYVFLFCYQKIVFDLHILCAFRIGTLKCLLNVAIHVCWCLCLDRASFALKFHLGALFFLLFLQLIADGNFAVSRRICINPTSARWTKRQWVMGVDPSTINVLIGTSLMIGFFLQCNIINWIVF